MDEKPPLNMQMQMTYSSGGKNKVPILD